MINPNEDSLSAKQLGRGSPTGISFLVGFFFGFRLFIMLLSVRVLGTDSQEGVEISLSINFLLLALVAFQSLGAADYSFKTMLRLPSIRWVLVFLCFSGCSLIWSVTASLPAACLYWCAMAADVAMVVLLLREGSISQTTISLMKGYVWGACLVAAIAWIMPAQSDLRLGDEELLGPNQIGYLCAFALFFVQYLMRQKGGKWWGASALLALTLLRSLSKTSILAFLGAELFLLARDRFITRRKKLHLAAAALVALAAFSGLLSSYLEDYANTGNQSETLTGRIGIWAYIGDEALQRPWFGYGFHSVWKVIPPFGAFEARHAHNELLQQFYAYGIVGVCMIAGLYGSFYLLVRKLKAGSMKTLLLALLIFVLIRGLADTEPFDLSLPLWAIVMLSVIAEKERIQARDEATASFAGQTNGYVLSPSLTSL